MPSSKPLDVTTPEQFSRIQAEVGKRAKLILTRVLKMEFLTDLPADVPDDKLTMLALFYLGLGVAAGQGIPASLAMQVMGAMYQSAEGLTVADLLDEIQRSVQRDVLAGMKPPDRVM